LAIIILYLGITTLFFTSVPIVGEYLALLLNYIIKFLNQSVYLIDSLPYSLSENIRFSITDTWLLYLFIICMICLIAYQKFIYIVIGSSFIILFLSSTFFLNYIDLDQRKIIIYNIPKFSAINFIDGKDNILISDINLIQNRNKLMFHVQNNWINSGVNKEKTVRLDHLDKKHTLFNNYRISNNNLFSKRNYFQFYSLKMVIINNHYQLNKRENKLAIDLLLITKNTKLTISELLKQFSPQQIVIDASNSTCTSQRLKKEAKDLNISCWSVLLDGAYIQNI